MQLLIWCPFLLYKIGGVQMITAFQVILLIIIVLGFIISAAERNKQDKQTAAGLFLAAIIGFIASVMLL
jgi:hypothetical protein